VLVKSLKEGLGFQPRNKNRPEAPMNQKRSRSRVVTALSGRRGALPS
jgi:hypothetical protein